MRSISHFARFVFTGILGAVLAVTLLVAPQAQGQTITTVYGFPGTPGPYNPNDEAIALGRDGELYLFAQGGDGNAVNCTITYCGELFQISTSGTVTDLYDLSNNSCPGSFCGYGAYGGLTLGSDGNFYGSTYYGGTNGYGTVFKVTPAGVATALYNFTGASDGSSPYAAPIQASNGTFYGTTTSAVVTDSTAYSVTSAGVFKTLHTFTGPDGQNVYAPLVQGTNGNFYGGTAAGGTNNDGVIFEMTPSGTVTVLHNFAGTDGSNVSYPLIQASDGNFYGTTYYGGTDGYGVVFRITPSGTYTVLHNLNGTTDGMNPAFALVQATDGKLYGVTSNIGVGYEGSVFSITLSGTFTNIYSFTGSTDGGAPLSPMIQHTDGLLYGTTEIGGDTNCYSVVGINGQYVIVPGCGELYSLNIGAKAFIKLSSTSGKVGSQVGIFGQGFSSSSVVKFNGVAATTTTLSGTTYITATVPAGATDGYVTVTTGTTTLTSTAKYTVHNSWASGAAIPVAVAGAATGVISGKIYVVSGVETYNGAAVSNNQVYNPSTNSWTTATAIPTPVYGAASAVVSGLLYVIGGSETNTGAGTNLVQIYNPKTNAWTTGAAMPTARSNFAAVVDGTSIYAIGGNGSTDRLTTVEKYVPSTNTWTEEAPLLTGVSDLSAGLLGSTVAAADGYTTSGDLGTTEGYDVSTNVWSALTSDPNPRSDSCYGVISGLLYVAGGAYANGSSTQVSTVNESFSATSDKWTSLAAIPTATFFPGSAVDNGQLYCLGGETGYQGTVIGNVQIYQP